jgi:hypothetical protein
MTSLERFPINQIRAELMVREFEVLNKATTEELIEELRRREETKNIINRLLKLLRGV